MTHLANLTPGQIHFLESYVEDILYGRPDMVDLSDGDFGRRISEMDFDGAIENDEDVKIARNLKKSKVLEQVDVHGPNLYVEFSSKGGAVMVEIIRKMQSENRLQAPKPIAGPAP
jgi:hypothetical protein